MKLVQKRFYGSVLGLAMLLLGASLACAQMPAFLLLEKPGTSKRYRYYAGDELIFLLEGEKKFHRGIISGIGDSVLVINGSTPVSIKEIAAIRDESKVRTVRGLAITALSTIPVWFFLSFTQNLFNTGRRPLIDPEVYTYSGIATGLALPGFLYKGRRYRLERRWRLLIIRH